jgi:tRNA threonylcarbamoyl adenosine modification protein YeaZ
LAPVLLIAFDTATPAVTVALHDGTHVLAETTTVDARRHGELLASSIDAVLTEAGAGRLDITAVAAGTGPGPYTGLRVGLVTARVLGSALGVPVYGVCTLDVIAADAAKAAGGREFIVATDARRREVYWARYDAGGSRLDGPAVGVPADVAELAAASQGGRTSQAAGGQGAASQAAPSQAAASQGAPRGAPAGRGILAAGAGVLLYPGILGEPLEPAYPAAGTLARLAAQQLAAGRPGTGAEPIYLRRPDARVPGPPKRVTVP